MSEVQTTLRLNDQASPTLQKVANSARQTASAMQQTGRAIDQAFRSNAPNTFASQASGALRGVLSSAEALGNTIANLFDGADMNEFGSEFDAKFQEASTAAAEFQEAVRSAGDVLDEVSDSAEELGDNLNDIGDGGSGLDNVGDDARQAGQEMEQASGSALNLGNALKTMAAAIGVAKIAGEVKQFVSDSISLGTGYSAMMSEVAAISGATGAEYDMLATTAREYGATTVFSASEAAEALKYMSLAGWDANQSASALGGVLNLAAASGMGLGQASDMVTDYLSAFGMEANQAGYFADMLAYAQANSNTSAEQLGQAYLNSAANLHAAGQDIETTTSLLEAMANQGTKGSRAGTQLAAITRDITNSMEDGAIKIGKTSVAVQDQYGNFRDLTDILVDVESAVDGMGSAERAAALAETFTADSTKGVNQILTEGMDNIIRYEEELRRSSGAAEDAADIMNDNLKGDMANMNSAFEEMQLQVFESLEGNLREGAQYVTSTIIPALTEWVPEAIGTVGDAIAKIGSALEPLFKVLLQNPKAVGTALATVGGGLAAIKAVTVGGNIATAITNMGGISGALSKLGGTLVANPWAAGAAAVVASIIAIKGAYDIWNETQIDKSLDSHFGTVELSDADAADLAGKIIGVDWVANINLALGEFENAEEFHEQAEEAIQSNQEILWKARVQTVLNHVGEDPINPFVEGISESLKGRESSSGLEFDPTVPVELEPGTPEATLAESLVEFANMAVAGATGEELNEYAKTVATQIDPDGDADAMAADLVSWAQGVVDGASGEELNDYINDVTVDLTPEESDTFYTSLQAVVTGMTETKLDEPPKWEDDLSIELTPEMAEDFKANIETFLDSKKSELESITFAAKTSMETVLGDKAGQAMISQMETWAAEDTAELNGLSESLTQLVQGALEDGVLDVEEQAAIDILQSKINNILSGWKQAQADAEWQTLQQKWSGRQITSDSFVQLMEEAHTQRQTAMDALYADTTEMNAVFNGWLNSGKINQGQRDQLDSLWTNNLMNMEGEAMGRSLSFGTNTLQDTYGELIAENLGRIQNNGDASGTINRLSEMATSGNWDFESMSSLMSTSRDFYSLNGGADRKALASMYKSMEPDVQDMAGLIDSYREQGMKVPTALMDAYNDAIEVGAAAGNASAGWQNYANWLWESGSDELKATLSDPSNPMYETMRNQMPQELQDALDRTIYAAENSTDSADLSEMFNAILGLNDPNAEIDMGRLSELCEKYGLDISDYLAEKGIDVDTNPKINLKDFDASEVASSLKHIDGLEFNAVLDEGIQFTISGDTPTVWNIASQLVGESGGDAEIAAAAQQILEANGWTELDAQNLIDGTEVIIPAELVVNEETLAASTGEAANEVAGKAGEVAETAQAAADAADSTVTTEVTQDVTVSAGDVDSSGVETAAQAAADDEFSDPLPTNGTTDVTLDETDNVPEVYNTVGTKVETAFSAGYNAAATVHVTLTADYSLANPAKTIEFGGGATGSTTVTATLHALGGYFDQAHLGMVAEDGPEYIIPMDGSDRSRDMWAEAGSMLGVMDKPIETMPGGSGNGARGATEATGGSKDINLNINGSGAMRITANVSPEDVLNVLVENIKDVLMDVIQNDILVEGDGAYEY